MPWELLSRLRRPVRRQHARPTPEPPLQDAAPQTQQEHSAPQLPINRKILQNPSSFLEAQVQPECGLPLGLTPSTRLPSADRSGHARPRPRQIDLSLEPLSARSELPPGSSVDLSPRTPSRFTINRISKIAGGGEWSTFGRKREHRVPDVGGVSGPTSPPEDPQRTSQSPTPTKDSKHLSADSAMSTFSLSRLANPSVTRGHPSPGTRSPRQSLDNRFVNQPGSSPTDTTSSKRHPRTPQRPSSYTTPVAAHATSPVTNFTTPVNRERAIDSPHTFGHPTPPDNPVEISGASPSLLPPLPPLDHPELAAVLSSRRQSTSTSRPTSAFRDRSNTLPTDRTPLRKEDLFRSLSLKLRRSLRYRPGLSQAEQVSNKTMTRQHWTRSPDAPHRRRRARTMSTGARQRRTSADWSSYQASVGVNSDGNQAWPAEVSREILRLSLADTPRRAGPEGVPESSEMRQTPSRDRNADPVRRPNRGAVSASFLPFPHPSLPNDPLPSTASATPADGREVILPRPQSLQFGPGNRRRSQRSTRLTMAEVKRSLSAIESRNARDDGAGGVVYPSFGISDPAQTLSEAPQVSLHLSSTLTPSQSLHSGRVSPTNTPMTLSGQGEPSTPTPAPRHRSMSDKSRGKRKAEDNIDLTPPEQKKEGQRATFLLPSETRSQRISGSSHAPSSYHRKRARLSSTSPFTTPAPSRSSSVHETPRSASRDHHFTSLSSSTGARMAPPGTPSRAASTRSRQPPTPSTIRRHERHQSISQVSIPISAIVTPHAPSVSRSTKFHMRDPRKPPKKPNDTPWSLRFATEDEPGSPLQAWCFFFGFLFFPIWWIAGLFIRVPKTRIAGDVDAEKGVTIDDPQIEHDARVWRVRCRVMAAVSLLTYVPFIVLVAIFAPR